MISEWLKVKNIFIYSHIPGLRVHNILVYVLQNAWEIKVKRVISKKV